MELLIRNEIDKKSFRLKEIRNQLKNSRELVGQSFNFLEVNPFDLERSITLRKIADLEKGH